MTNKHDGSRGPTTSADVAGDEYSSSLEAASPEEQEIQAGLAEAALVLVQAMQAKWDRGDRDAPVETDSRGPWTALLCVIVHETNANVFEHAVAQGADVLADDGHRVKGPAGRVALLIGDIENLFAIEANSDARDIDELRRSLASGDYAATLVATETVVCVRVVATRPVEPSLPAPNRLPGSLKQLILARWTRGGVA